MIVVLGHLTINPDARDAALAAIEPFLAATRAEDGCLDYRFSFDAGDPDRLNGAEIWESQAAMDAHMASPHMAEFMGAAGGFIGGSVEFITYDVASSTKLL